MTQDELKQAVARAAIEYIEPKLENDTIVGVGTGSTANFFIDYLAGIKGKIAGTVASFSDGAAKIEDIVCSEAGCRIGRYRHLKPLVLDSIVAEYQRYTVRSSSALALSD